MRKGLDFFTPRTGSVEDSLLKVEKAIGFKLPPAYTNFLLKYVHGESGLNREMIFKNEYNRWEIAGSILFPIKNDRPVSIYYFNDLDQILSTWESIDKYEETGLDKKIISIGMLSSDPNGGLYVGFGENNLDKIYRVNWDLGENRIMPIASSIWEFVEGLVQDYGNS